LGFEVWDLGFEVLGFVEETHRFMRDSTHEGLKRSDDAAAAAAATDDDNI
jgi:hypothetical protein